MGGREAPRERVCHVNGLRGREAGWIHGDHTGEKNNTAH